MQLYRRKRGAVLINYQTSLQGIELPILIPKMGKGHQECSASFSLYSSSFVEAFRDISLLMEQAKQICSEESLHLLCDKISPEEDILVSVEFLFVLDKISSSFKDYYYSMPVVYQMVRQGETFRFSKSITLPAYVEDVKLSHGRLTLVLENPGKICLEDMAEVVRKSTGLFFLPVTSVDDKHKLSVITAKSLTCSKLLAGVRDYCIKKGVGSGGRVELVRGDVYNTLKLGNKLVW